MLKKKGRLTKLLKGGSKNKSVFVSGSGRFIFTTSDKNQLNLFYHHIYMTFGILQRNFDKSVHTTHLIQCLTSWFIPLPAFIPIYIRPSKPIYWHDWLSLMMVIVSTRNWSTVGKDWVHLIDVTTAILTIISIAVS